MDAGAICADAAATVAPAVVEVIATATATKTVASTWRVRPLDIRRICTDSLDL
jgi:hypothetical protein